MPHMPGPWRQSPVVGDSAVVADAKHVRSFSRFQQNAVAAYGGALVCESVSPENGPLICVAPDLFEAAVVLESTLRASLGEDAPLVLELRALIRRAQGAAALPTIDAK